MNQGDQNINKDMNDFDLIDVDSLDFSDDQTWLSKVPNDSGDKLDIVDWSLSLDWPVYDDDDYSKTESEIYTMLDDILKDHVLSMPDKHKFDSRTYVKPKRRPPRPSIQSIVETSTPQLGANKYMTYNKYKSPMAGPILRLKTFNVDTNTDNSAPVKEYAMKRRSLIQDDDPAIVLQDEMPTDGESDRLSAEYMPTKPINIDLSQPAHNLHNTFNKGYTNLNDRGSLNMYQSGESLMRMSPPSLVSSLLMETSGNFNQDTDGRKSTSLYKDSGISGPTSGRESMDPMLTSMTLSILDEKDMSTSFLSQTTYPEHDSLMDSLPPSLVNSVNSSFIVSKHKDSTEPNNVFSSATFTHLEQSEKLLSARPRHQMFNSFTKSPRSSESYTKSSHSYTKARDESPSKDLPRIVSSDNSDSPRLQDVDMCETITLHYANNKFRNRSSEKENHNITFEKDDAFNKTVDRIDTGKTSMNVTLDNKELNEIIQARQKLSLARKALPVELTSNVETAPSVTLTQPVQVTVPKKSMENASELLARRRLHANGYDKEENVREPPRRNATFKKPSPQKCVDNTVVYVKDPNLIDINSATMTLVDQIEKLDEEWNPQERAMVGSTESTDTATFSSSSPPDSVPDTTSNHDHTQQVESTPMMTLKRNAKQELMNLHATISPIYDMTDDRSYTITSITPRPGDLNTTIINTGTIVKRTAPKRDILAGHSPEKPRSPLGKQQPVGVQMVPPTGLPRKTNLPTSKLRQYSSHKELRLPLGGPSAQSSSQSLARAAAAGAARSNLVRRAAFSSNPALSPTAPLRRDSYTITPPLQENGFREESADRPSSAARPPLVRQGTETLRRDRTQSQLVPPKDLRGTGPGSAVPVPTRNSQIPPPPTTRSYTIASNGQHRVSRPSSVPKHSSAPLSNTGSERPGSSETATRVSALPRPSRLPAPRRTLRPPSVYSVAPTADADHY